MDCGISLLSGNWWAGFLTWIAFAVVVTAAVTFVAARRRPEPGRVPGSAQPPEDLRRLSERVEDLARRLDALEGTRGA
jgi:membrane protein implicated in regulation of membrane protease activity